MPRADLLALSLDDLTALTNRGTVKRAQRELETGELTVEIKEAEDGTVMARWSDDVQCLLPGGAVVANSRCTCPATELCRHIIRTVLAYQKQASAARPTEAAAVWNPGEISDEALSKHFKPAALRQAQEQFQNGLLVEVVKSHKPTARFHDLACTLRFQVPGDVRYVHCDCAGEPPCIHVPLAVWAFRQLPADKAAAILSTQTQALPVPVEALDQIDEVLLEGLEVGLAGATNAWRDRLARLEAQCRNAGLIWPSEVIVELIHQYERYAEHDARFSADRYSELVGELLIRADAIRNDTGAVPQLLIRGTAADRWTDLASARFIGLGCGVRLGRRLATLSAFLQDANSGSMVAVSREFADPAADAKEPPKAFWQLAQTPVIKGASFALVGAGQLLTQGGKRATDHELVLGRAKATVNPQNFSWESLRPPVLAESFAEVRARLGALPPVSLRPRRVAEDFHVCPVAGLEQVLFHPAEQAVQAVVKDLHGDLATLQHPYTSRGGEGAERLLKRLRETGDRLRFVAGPMRLTAEGLRIDPVSLVFQDENTRTMLQPWIDRWQEADKETSASPLSSQSHERPLEPLGEFQQHLLEAVGETFVLGLRRADATVIRSWQELLQSAEKVGMARLAHSLRRVVEGLARKSTIKQWEWKPTAQAVLEHAVLARLSHDLSSTR